MEKFVLVVILVVFTFAFAEDNTVNRFRGELNDLKIKYDRLEKQILDLKQQYAQEMEKNAKLQKKIEKQNVPIGGIIIFFGKDIPENFVLCNGQKILDTNSPLQGTVIPDLRGKFVRGLASGQKLGDHGGKDQTTHHHHVLGDTSTSNTWGGDDGNFVQDSKVIDYRRKHDHSISFNTKDTATDNVPEYVALHYIIRIK